MQDRHRIGNKLLVAEDNEINLLVVSRMLEILGYEFDAVENGLDGIKLFEQNEYDLVLTDIQMPGMDGMQVASKIRTMKTKKRDTPIVAMTANADLEEAKRFYAVGINDVLAKPFNKAELLKCIKKWL
ncbi:MAG: response regulator [Paracoccaceae bacterium]|nr:response regulator [Paracoccaceae bacterium]